MKKILLFAVLAMVYSCASHGPNNPYIGHIPVIQAEEGAAYKEFVPEGVSWSESEGKKYAEMIEKEKVKLEGTVMPCVSGQPDIFEVVGDNAAFEDGGYQILIEFKKAVSVMGNSIPYNVVFYNTEDKHNHLGAVRQILFTRTRMVDGLTRRLYSFDRLDRYLVKFFINSIDTRDANLLQEKANVAVIFLDTDSYRVVDKFDNAYYYPENSACYLLKSIYYAIIENDTEEYFSLEDDLENIDGFEEDEWEYFNHAYNLWKKVCPDKWKVIKEYRQKVNKEKGLSYDVADPV
ncbi:MAG: hypothetical protein J6X63_05935 [Bacteroidales bacterium]|nr:hypothetical protein [Bacteroidales bacterium]